MLSLHKQKILTPSARWPGGDALPLRAQLEICREQVEWARTEKRTFLRQRIEARLANLLLHMGDYSGALALIGKLLTEVRCRSRCRREGSRRYTTVM